MISDIFPYLFFHNNFRHYKTSLCHLCLCRTKKSENPVETDFSPIFGVQYLVASTSIRSSLNLLPTVEEGINDTLKTPNS